jgi:DNA-binding NtrC family response regulator
MQRYPWPGNVRQLENLVERLTILHPGSEIGPEAVADDLRPLAGEPLSPAGAVQSPTRRAVVEASGPQADMRVVDQIERNAITDALASSKGKVREAAQFLGLSQATMYRKLKRYGISLEDYNPSAGGTPPPSRVDV